MKHKLSIIHLINIAETVLKLEGEAKNRQTCEDFKVKLDIITACTFFETF